MKNPLLLGFSQYYMFNVESELCMVYNIAKGVVL